MIKNKKNGAFFLQNPIFVIGKLRRSIQKRSCYLEGRGYEHFEEVGIIHMNGRLYDPLLRRFLNADENIQDPYNTQNYNKYGYVMNNPLLYNDPSGEVFVVLGSAILGAIITGAAVGVVAYTITLGITGNIDNWSIGGAMKSMFFGAVGGAASFGVGSLFSSHLTGATALATSIKESVGGVGLAVVQAGTHAVSQGVLGLMQGQNFLSASLSGFAGSLGASGWSSIVGSSGASMIAFGALSGGVASELSGGNFWTGAFTGGIVAGLNHTMHKMQQRQKEETYEDKLRKRLKGLKIGDVIEGKELNVLNKRAGLVIENIEKISNNQYKVNRKLLGKAVLDKNTILTINTDGKIGNHKGILITKKGSQPFKVEYEISKVIHTYNTLLLKENRIYYKYNNKIYNYSIK